MQRTNVQVVGAAAALATVTMWLLGFFAPELMAEAPVGLESGLVSIFVMGAGLIFHENTVIAGKLPMQELAVATRVSSPDEDK